MGHTIALMHVHVCVSTSLYLHSVVVLGVQETEHSVCQNDCEATLLKIAPVRYWLFVIQGLEKVWHTQACTAHIAIRREERDREEWREGGGGK